MRTYHKRDFSFKGERENKPKQFSKIYSIPLMLRKIP